MARIMKGAVVSDSADKTIVVATEQRKSHPLYSKQYTVTKRIKAHDAKNQAKVGDMVIIAEGRRRSKDKSWELQEVTVSAEETS